MVFAGDEILRIETVSGEILQSAFEIFQDCKTCKIFDAYDDCFESEYCDEEKLIYCCNSCNGTEKSFCSTYGVPHEEDGEIEIKKAVLHVNDDGTRNFKVIFLNNFLENCNLELSTFSFSVNGTLVNTVSGNYVSCSRFVNMILLLKIYIFQ